LFGFVKEFGQRREHLLPQLELCMLSLTIMAFQWVPLVQPGGLWKTLPQDRHFSSTL